MADYSIQELMIVAAAREIRDGEVVFVGMRLPITAYGVARLTHAPNAVGLFECGIVRYGPADGMLYTMGDPPNQLGAAWSTGLVQVMSQLQRGRVDAGFIGGAEIESHDQVAGFGGRSRHRRHVEAPAGDHEPREAPLGGAGGLRHLAGIPGRRRFP